MNDEAHRRATQRVPFNEELRFVRPPGVVGQGVDIGAGGVGVNLPVRLPPETQVEMEIFGGAATAYGTVRWVKEEEGHYRTGIQFREDDWAIMELVQSLRDQER